MNEKFTTTVATMDNLLLQQNGDMQDIVIYFCESHNKSTYEKSYIRSTVDLFYRYQSELSQCEKYELRTGYLSRWNYMSKDFDKINDQEMEEAIIKGYDEENEWLKRCEPVFPERFITKDWQDCISQKENPYYHQVKALVLQELEQNSSFKESFAKSVSAYVTKHNTNYKNGEQYLLEETAWVLSVPLVHPNKYIYLVHIGKANAAIKELFNVFPNFSKTCKLIRPHIYGITFKNEADFLMHYNSHRDVGCSWAMDHRDIADQFILKKVKSKSQSFFTEFLEKNLYQDIVEQLPCNIYWVNRDNVYLGCNTIQLSSLGLKSMDEMVGKTNFDLHDSVTAKKLDDINELVMSTGKTHEVEESGYILGKHRNCLTRKVALFDSFGKVIGMLGASLDITDRRNKAEELEKELAKQRELYELAEGVAHDICSPLSSLEMVKYMSFDKLSPKEREMFDLSLRGVRNIANGLLEKYRKRNDKGNLKEEINDEGCYIAPYTLKELIDRKNYEYKNNKVDIKFCYDKENRLVFIRGDFIDFSRMISNLINNAVESIGSVQEGLVVVSYKVYGEEVEIKVKDNGIGMSANVLEKINKREAPGTTKEDGNGLGLRQVLKVIENMRGELKVNSTEQEGTEFVMRFNKVESPKWFAKGIELKEGDTVVVLDDEVLMHEAWKLILDRYKNKIMAKYFTEGKEAIRFLKSIGDKNKVFLITDYELKDQGLNGVNVIEESGMQERHILVTGKNLSDIKEFKSKSDFLKLFGKMQLKDIKITVV